MSDAARKVASELRDEHRIRRARVHPIQVLSALLTYQQGHGVRGRSTWQPVSQVVDALDDAFYISFGNVEPTGKRIVLALDVSGSMGSGMIAGVPGLTPRIGSCAMAMVTARCEPNHVIVAFSDKMIPVEISLRERLDDVVKKTSAIPFGGTDCALPMLWALGYNTKSGWNRTAEYIQERSKVIEADAFVTYTDSETWFGNIHPVQALQKYRKETGIPAKLVTVGMVSNGFSISDPKDGGCLDVVGFDTATPNLISDFIGS
jgi:60 kDa SS-A/Ro ribonucleoprotein